MERVEAGHPEIPVAKLERRYYLLRSGGEDRHYIAPPSGAHLVIDEGGVPVRVSWTSIIDALGELNGVVGVAA